MYYLPLQILRLAKDVLDAAKAGQGFGEFIPAFVSFTADMRGYYLPDEVLSALQLMLRWAHRTSSLQQKYWDLGGCCMSWALKDQNEARLRITVKTIISIPDYVTDLFNVAYWIPI